LFKKVPLPQQWVPGKKEEKGIFRQGERKREERGGRPLFKESTNFANRRPRDVKDKKMEKKRGKRVQLSR